MTELNRFGKKKYRNKYANTAALNATKSWTVPITQEEIDNYGPFTRFIIFNRDDAVTVGVRLDSVVFGDDTVLDSTRQFHMLKETAMELEDKDNIVFERILITNEDAAANIDIGEVVVMFSNY